MHVFVCVCVCVCVCSKLWTLFSHKNTQFLRAICLFFGHDAQFMGSQFPNQWLNPDHGSENLES